MRNARTIIAGVAVVAAGTAVVVHQTRASTASSPQTCHASAGGALPDPSCTPGVADRRVTQTNISLTICVRGYTTTMRPSAAYTSTLKRRQIAAYGYSDTNPRHYEEDHLVSLELGGAPSDPRNLWPERGASPNSKDLTENRLHAEVCARRITLSDAQHLISTDWRAA